MSYPAADKYARRRIVIVFEQDEMNSSAKSFFIKKWRSKEYVEDNFKFIQIKNINEVEVGKSDLRAAFCGVSDNFTLYIVGHCGSGDSYLTSTPVSENRRFYFSVDVITNLITDCLPINSFGLPFDRKRPKFKISLTACYAGVPNYRLADAYVSSRINNSFAARLQHRLTQHHVYCDVIARMGVVYFFAKENVQKVIMPEKDQEYRKILKKEKDLSEKKNDSIKNTIHYNREIEHLLDQVNACCFPEKDIRSKVIYRYDSIQRKQVILPAYEMSSEAVSSQFNALHVTLSLEKQTYCKMDSWKLDAWNTINKCMRLTRCPNKQEGLYRLLRAVSRLSGEDAYLLINQALLCEKPNEGYHINTHSNWYGYGQTNTAKELNALLARRHWL